MLPIYTRYLSPADYGAVGLLMFTVALIEIIFGARLFQAVPKFYFEQDTKREGHAVISTALMITSAVSSLSMLAVVAFRVPISEIAFGTGDYGLLVGIFAVLILTHALENYALGYVRIQQRPWLFISASMVKLFMQLSLNIWFVVIMEWGVLGVAYGSVISSVIFTAGMTLYTLFNTGISFSSYIAKRMLLFSWPLWLAGLAGLYIGSANRYYIRLFSSLDDVGLFELAAKFGTIITLLIWMPFSQYWQTERFRLYQEPNPIPIYQAVFKLISTLLVMAALGVAIFGGPVIRIMAAPEFHVAAEAVPYLVFSAVFQCLVYFGNFSFLVKEKTGWMTWNSYMTAVVATALYFALIPFMGFVGAAQALMLANGFQFIVVHFAAKKHYDMKISLLPLVVLLVIAGVSLAVAFSLEQSDLLADIAVKLVVYIISCICIAASLLLNAKTRTYIGRLIGKHFSQTWVSTATASLRAERRD